jgi:hypothetical protein
MHFSEHPCCWALASYISIIHCSEERLAQGRYLLRVHPRSFISCTSSREVINNRRFEPFKRLKKTIIVYLPYYDHAEILWPMYLSIKFPDTIGVMPSPPRPSLLRCAETRGEIPPLQRSISVRCSARVIIAHTPSTRIACEMHAMGRREVYCPPSHWLC